MESKVVTVSGAALEGLLCSENNVLQSPLLELCNVSVVRNGNPILQRINLCIPRQRHTVILGANGAGKTSLLNLLQRKYYPSVEADGTQGCVRILGMEIWEVASLRSQMGIVTSALDHSFSVSRTGRMTVAEAVASGFTATELAEFGIELTPAIRARIERALCRVAAAHLIDRRVSTLSTGERRRTLIARALIHDPQILVLDEPTTGLDIAARYQFLKIVSELIEQHDLTLVIVTHHLEEILPSINHVVLLANGQVQADDEKERVLVDTQLTQAFGIPVHVERSGDGHYWARVNAQDLSTVG